ncbi:hypothetical protein [Croceicoccus marinus]|uniref:hypothetical protein n=1 Tax=Croceicoccus marinus TaxID=450378 RepID=UPI0012F9428E|nr:hypothetical protein [Croceicoccus marinus]
MFGIAEQDILSAMTPEKAAQAGPIFRGTGQAPGGIMTNVKHVAGFACYLLDYSPPSLGLAFGGAFSLPLSVLAKRQGEETRHAASDHHASQ